MNVTPKKSLSAIMIDGPAFKKTMSEHICHVHFVKADGSERHMICTRSGEFIPERHQPGYKDPNEPIEAILAEPFDIYQVKVRNLSQEELSGNLIKTYDLEAGAWRSFKLSNVLSWWHEKNPMVQS